MSKETRPQMELLILKAIKQLQHTGNFKVSTRNIAALIYLSPSHTWRYLHKLESEGSVKRIGKRKGWRLAKPNDN